MILTNSKGKNTFHSLKVEQKLRLYQEIRNETFKYVVQYRMLSELIKFYSVFSANKFHVQFLKQEQVGHFIEKLYIFHTFTPDRVNPVKLSILIWLKYHLL